MEFTNNDIPNNNNEQWTYSIMEDPPALHEMSEMELAESDQNMVTTSNHSKETQDVSTEPELCTRHGRKII